MLKSRLPSYILALILTLTLSSCGFSTTTTSQASSSAVIARARAHPTIETTASGSVWKPVRLIIPAIGVNASVESVEILANGDLGTPTRNPWDDVGWYDLGPHVGERGSTVIDGHLDRPGGYPAVFWNLRNVHIGNEVMTINTQGQTLRFRVTRIAFYPPQAAPLQEIFGNEEGSYLNLITCAGDWIPSQHQTTLRLVVYTTLA